MTDLFVLTSPRKTGDDPWRYVRAVIKQVEEEKIGNENHQHLVVDGSLGDELALRSIAGPTWYVYRYDRPEGQWLGGNKWPYWYLLQIAASFAHRDGDAAVVLEDDLEFAPNSLRRMLLFPIPNDVNVVQFFSAFLFRQKKMPIGLWRTPAPVAGCQALKFSAATLQVLCRWKSEDAEWQKYNESDVALGLAQQRLGIRFAHHLPDVIQHIGDISAVNHGMLLEAGIKSGDELYAADRTLAERTSMNYVGPHFDCMRLFGRDELYR